MNGPTWLHVKYQWPTWQQFNISHLHAIAAVSDIFQPETQTLFTIGLYHVLKASNYSTVTHLLLITAYVLRFIFNLCHHKLAPFQLLN